MKCKNARTLISLLVDGELDAAQRGELLLHCSECASCRKEKNELEALKGLFNSTERPVPPPFLMAKIRARIRDQERERIPFLRRTPVFGTLALGAALAFMALTGNYLGSSLWENVLNGGQSATTEMVSLFAEDTPSGSVSSVYSELFSG